MKMYVVSANSYEGSAYHYKDMEGYPAAYLVPTVEATVSDGRVFALPNHVSIDWDEQGWQVMKVKYDIAKAHQIADAVVGRMYIEAIHWVEVDTTPEYETIEDRFNAEAEREALERF